MREAREIVRQECDYTGITVEELWKGSKSRSYVDLRRKIIYRLRTETRLSWMEIGMLVGLNSKPNKQFAKEVALRGKVVIHIPTTTTSIYPDPELLKKS